MFSTNYDSVSASRSVPASPAASTRSTQLPTSVLNARRSSEGTRVACRVVWTWRTPGWMKQSGWKTDCLTKRNCHRYMLIADVMGKWTKNGRILLWLKCVIYGCKNLALSDSVQARCRNRENGSDVHPNNVMRIFLFVRAFYFALI